MIDLADVQHRRASSYEPRELPTLSHRLRGLFTIPNARKVIPRRLSRQGLDAPASFESGNKDRVTPKSRLKRIELHSEQSPNRSRFDEEVPPSPTHLLVRRNYSIAETSSPARQLCYDPVAPESNLDRSRACDLALSLPEIVENVLTRLDEEHWNCFSSILTRKAPRSEAPVVATKPEVVLGPLNQCLYVNSVFYECARRVLSRKVELSKIEHIDIYINNSASKDNLCRDLLIHRLKTCDQETFDEIKQFRLRSLELYVCPNLIPSTSMMTAGTLRKIALPGCGLVNDVLMEQVAMYCSRLEILDLRACELITDVGLIVIAEHCPRLTYLNVGRVRNASNITDVSIIELCRKTSVETLGLAGCAIGDASVLAIAQYSGARIERLSMNQCHGVSDASIEPLLAMSPKLQVLEIVGCERVRNSRSLAFFKVLSGALVETDKSLASEMETHEADAKVELDAINRRARRSQRRNPSI